MNYSRFLDPDYRQPNYDGLIIDVELDHVEIEPGHTIDIELVGQAVWDNGEWYLDRLSICTYRHEIIAEDVIFAGAGNPIKVARQKTIADTLRIDDRAEFKAFVRAAEEFVNKHYQPEDYV